MKKVITYAVILTYLSVTLRTGTVQARTEFYGAGQTGLPVLAQAYQPAPDSQEEQTQPAPAAAGLTMEDVIGRADARAEAETKAEAEAETKNGVRNRLIWAAFVVGLVVALKIAANAADKRKERDRESDGQTAVFCPPSVRQR